MDRLQSAFTNLRARAHSSADSLPQPVADEWYIPYNGQPSQIYEDKKEVSKRILVKSSSHGNLLSVMCGGGMAKGQGEEWYEQRRLGQAHNPNPATDVQRSMPGYQKGSSEMASSSPPDLVDRFPSYTSVPTGLSEPNILFSPIIRQLRAQAEGYNSHTSAQPFATPVENTKSYVEKRRRTVSAPHRSNLDLSNPTENKDQPRQWYVASTRDLFLHPKPQILPQYHNHKGSVNKRYSNSSLATSTDSEDAERALESQRARFKERDDWAQVVRKRGRSLSLGGRGQPPAEALPVGNARAREDERSRSRDRNRNNSTAKLAGGAQGRKRSTSLSSRWAMHSRGSSMSRDDGYTSEGSRSFLDFTRSKKHDDVPTSFTFARAPSTARHEGYSQRGPGASDPGLNDGQTSTSRNQANLYTRGYTQSNPNINDLVLQNEARNPAATVPANRSLQFKQPSVADKGGVVVIGRGATTRRAGATRTSAVPAPLDFSKPLPNLPMEARSSAAPGDMPASPSFDTIGDPSRYRDTAVLDLPESAQEFARDNLVRTPSDEIGVAISPVIDQESPENSPALKQDEQAEKRLSDGSSKARAFLAKQQQRARMRRAFKSPVQSPSGYRRPDGINSFMISPLGTSSSTTNSSKPANDSSDIMPQTPKSPPAFDHDQPSGSLGRGRAVSVGAVDKQERRIVSGMGMIGERPKSETDTDSKSQSDIMSNGDSRGKINNSQSMVQDDEDFHGLFFRTPYDPHLTPSIPSNVSYPPVPTLRSRHDDTGPGLRPKLSSPDSDAHPRRESAGSDGTVLHTPDDIISGDTLGDSARTQLKMAGTTLPARRLMAPISMGKPIETRSRDMYQPSGELEDREERESLDDSRFAHAQQTPSTHFTPSLPESGVMPPQIPSVEPSPVTFTLSRQQGGLVPHSHFPNNLSSQQRRRYSNFESKLDMPVSPSLSVYRDSVAVSFVDEFPTPPERLDRDNDDQEERFLVPTNEWWR